MTWREYASVVASVAFLTAIALDQARTSARVQAIEARTAKLQAALQILDPPGPLLISVVTSPDGSEDVLHVWEAAP